MSFNIIRTGLLFVALALSAPVAAQAVGPDPINDVTRYKVYFYKFAPGGKDLARQMIWDHILPAMRKAKVPEPLVLHPEDGEWDMISLYPLPGGYTDLHYNSSPSDARWQSIATSGENGDAFKNIASQLQALIVRETSLIAHCHNCGK
jgi:hypothetical protein